MMISTEKSLLRHLYKTDDSVKNAVIFSLSYHVRKKIDEGKPVKKSSIEKISSTLITKTSIVERLHLPKKKDDLALYLSVEPQ